MKIQIGASAAIIKATHEQQLVQLGDVPIGGLAAAVLTPADTDALQTLVDSALPLPVFIVGDIATPLATGNLHRHEVTALNDHTWAEIQAAATGYLNAMVPGFLQDLLAFSEADPTTFATPGHHSGHYLEHAPAGYQLVAAYGHEFFASDTSDVVTALGDMMTHGGTPLQAEQAAAKLYHADKAYFVTNGTTTSNNIVAAAALQPGDLVLFDRNNHKSFYNSALILNGATPLYLDTLRTELGLIGPVDLANATPAQLRQAVAKLAPEKQNTARPFRIALLELETFDGIVPDAATLIHLFGPLCDYIAFDAAWGGYESFLPAMAPLDPLQVPLTATDPGILVTQSVHKQQAGFAQTSQILKKDRHIRGQSRYISHAQFNHAYLKYVTTSYSYPVYASLVANVALNQGAAGQHLWAQALADSLAFRRAVTTETTLFRPYNAKALLTTTAHQAANDPAVWALKPDTDWHGLTGLHAHQAYLDPMKVTLTLPHTKTQGISGWVVDRYLLDHNIVPEKADPHSLLFLVTPGTGATDWAHLLTVLKQFEADYLADRSVKVTLPQLVQETGDRYAHTSLRELCQGLSDWFSDHRLVGAQRQLFQNTNANPTRLSAAQADAALMRGQYDTIPLADAAGHVAVEGALPYPPGIFVVVPGEVWRPAAIAYFKTLFDGIEAFPGFTPEIQGLTTAPDGTPMVNVWREPTA